MLARNHLRNVNKTMGAPVREASCETKRMDGAEIRFPETDDATDREFKQAAAGSRIGPWGFTLDVPPTAGWITCGKVRE